MERGALVIIAVVVTGFLWVITVAPAAVAFAVTVGVAVAWCAWLEEHAEPP